jgi:hypothetical protein
VRSPRRTLLPYKLEALARNGVTDTFAATVDKLENILDLLPTLVR